MPRVHEGSGKEVTVVESYVSPSSDGMGRTGAFICIHAQLERLKTEGVMDVFQFAKSARFHRGHLILELVRMIAYTLCLPCVPIPCACISSH